MSKSKEFDQQITQDVRARGSFTLHDDGTREFSYQLEVFENGVYIWIRRYDTSHGYPHYHVRHPSGREENHIPMTTDYAAAHDEAQREIFKNALLHVKRYRGR